MSKFDETLTQGCRICWEVKGNMISPCHCKGMLRNVHKDCLQAWIGSIIKKHPERITVTKQNEQLFKCQLCHSFIPFKAAEATKFVCRECSEMKTNGDFQCLIGLIIFLFIWEAFSVAIIFALYSDDSFDSLTLGIIITIMVIPLPFVFCFLLKRSQYTKVRIDPTVPVCLSANNLCELGEVTD